MRRAIVCAVAATAFCMAFACAAWAFDIPPRDDSDGFVCDYGNIISPKMEAEFENELAVFERKTSIEICVVTITSLEGDVLEDVAERLFNTWGIGKKGKDNGVLFLVAWEDHVMRIETGYGIEPFLTDAKADRIVGSSGTVADFFRRQDVDRGIWRGVQLIEGFLGEYSPAEREAEAVRLREEEAKLRARQEEMGRQAGLVLLFALGLGIITFFLYRVVRAIARSSFEKKRKAALALEVRKEVDRLQGVLGVSRKQMEAQALKCAAIPAAWAKLKAEALVNQWRRNQSTAEELLASADEYLRGDEPDSASAKVKEVLDIFANIPGIDKALQKFGDPESVVEGLVASVLEAIASARVRSQHQDAMPAAATLVEEAGAKYREGMAFLDPLRRDWWAAWPLLAAAGDLASRASQVASDAIRKAEEARRPKPKPAVIVSSPSRRRSPDDSSTRWSSGSSGISLGGGGGGGFSLGGGMSGGGGASGKW